MSEKRPVIVDLEREEAPAHTGKVVLAIFGGLIAALFIKTFPWLTPVWLGPAILAAVVADIISLYIVRRERPRLDGITIYHLMLPKRTVYTTDDTNVRPLIGRLALALPVGVGVVVAVLTAGFFIYRHGFAMWRFHFGSLAPVIQCVPILAGVAGIYASLLVSRKVLAWRLGQAALRNAGLPNRHVPASSTFIVCTLLSLYVLGGFGQKAYEALKPVPPPKTIGDLVFSSPSPKGTFLIEHRESLSPTSEARWELFITDSQNPSSRTLLHSYARAAKVTFSPDESRLIVSEKKEGSVRPLFMVPVSSLQGGAMGFVHQMRENRMTLDQRLRTSYSSPGDGSWQTDDIWVGEWATEANAVVFIASAKGQAGKERQPNRLYVWDYKQDTFAKIDEAASDQTEALKSFLAEKARRADRTLRISVIEAIQARMVAENRRDADGIAELYTPVAMYRENGFTARDAIQSKRIEEFRQWKESRETVAGEIRVQSIDDGNWRGRWKTNAEFHSPERRETLKQDRAYECEFINQKGRFLISKEVVEITNAQTISEPPPPVVKELPKPPVALAIPITPPPAPSTPKPLKFPEGTWTNHNQERDAQENVVWNNVLTVRGTVFQYDLNQTHDLIDPANPWTANALRGLNHHSYTIRYTGKVIRSDGNSFVAKVEEQKVVNKKPPAMVITLPSNWVGAEWIFIKNRDGIFDKRAPNTTFQSVSSAGGK